MSTSDNESYIEIVYRIPTEQLEVIELTLFEHGVLSIEQDPELPEVLRVIVPKSLALPPELDEYLIGYKRLESKDWKDKWLDYYEGAQLTDDVSVIPEGIEFRSTSAIQILLDPQDAFGDGRHPTTQQCATYLSDYIQDLSDETKAHVKLLDIGTGTGILSILAAKLGLSHIHAFDIEDDSVQKAQANVDRNDCSHIQIFQADVTQWTPSEPYDVIVANVLTQVLIDTFDTLITWVSPSGTLILSGVSLQNIDEMDALIRDKEISYDKKVMEGWAAFRLHLKP